MRDRPADILVAGAGPAGATIARLLAKRGRRVTLVDPAMPSVDRLEIVAPSGNPVIEALGLAPLLRRTAIARPCLGIRRRWGAAETEIDDFFRRPGGLGFAIDRMKFDDALRAAAVDAGVTVVAGRVVAARRHAGEMAAEIASASGRFAIAAGLLIDATGRPAAVARRMGARRLPGEALIAERRQIDRSHTHCAEPGWLDVKGRANGWSYRIAGPDGRRESWAVYRPATRGRRYSRLRVEASSMLLSRAAGEGWIAVGDAASSFDPITSQGLVNALSSALVAAGAILSPRGLDDEARSIYSDAIAATFRHSESGRAAVYHALTLRR
jgi:flavin-dependent dehydrogenase